MNPRNTLRWVVVAAALFAFIFFYERHARPPESGPEKVLPGLNASAVSSVEILPKGQLAVRAERTNGNWQLTEPFSYPAQSAGIENLLIALEGLMPTTYITERELKSHRRPDEEFGIEPPQASLVIQQGEYRLHLGYKTPPGDGVYLQVVGKEGIYVVGADLLKFIPQTANDWRDARLVDWQRLAFNRVVVTNTGNVLELRRDATNQLWRMILPGWEVRADSDKIQNALRRLQSLRATQFVLDDANADFESYGLQPPNLSLALDHGTNSLLLLEFGKSPTNDTSLVYARRADQNTIVTVSKDLLAPWRAPDEAFRDRHLVTLTGPLAAIEIHAPAGSFTLQRETNRTWRVLPQGSPGFPADTALVSELVTNMSGLEVTGFVQDAVTPLDLPSYGLTNPARRIILKAVGTNAVSGPTNTVVAELDFGVQGDKVFAQRAGESSVYAIKPADFARLPSAAWQMRDRRIWNFSETNVWSVVIHQDGKTRELVHSGTNWSFAAGSQGVINDFAVEETVHRLGELTAVAWAARGDQNRAQFGFAQNNLRLSLELKSGETLNIEFGGVAPSGFPYAAIALDKETWIFEFPWPLYQYVQLYLTIPANNSP